VDGLSLYTYVRGNPLRFVDPYGLEICAPEGSCPEFKEWVECMLDCLSTCDIGAVQQVLNDLADNDVQVTGGDLPPGLAGYTSCDDIGSEATAEITIDTDSTSSGEDAATFAHELAHAHQCQEGQDPAGRGMEDLAELFQEICNWCGCGDQCKEEWDNWKAKCPKPKKPVAWRILKWFGLD
jgi:hypothetical protein